MTATTTTQPDTTTVDNREFAAKLALVSRITGQLRITTGPDMTIAATDGTITMTATVNSSHTGDPAVFAADKTLAKRLGLLNPGPAHITVEDDTITIDSAATKYTIPRVGAAAIPEPSTASTVPVDTAFFDAARFVLTAVGTDKARPVLTGIYVEPELAGIRLTATDSYRLATATHHISVSTAAAVIPARLFTEAAKLAKATPGAPARFGVGEHTATVTVGDVTIHAQLIPGLYPAYRQLFQSHAEHHLTVETKQLLDVTRRVTISGDDPIRIAIDNSGGIHLAMHATDGATADEQLSADSDGGPVTVGLNSKYLQEAVKAFDETISIDIDEPVRPVTIRDDTGLYSGMPTSGRAYLLMPVRI